MSNADDERHSTMTTFKRVLAVKAAHQDEIMTKANVLGVGIGYHQSDAERSESVALIVLVREKKPLTELDSHDVLPNEIDGVPVVVRSVGSIHPHG